MKTNKTTLRKDSTSNVVAFRRNKLAVAVATATLSIGSSQLVQAGPGYGDAVNQAGTPFRIPTFFANSPSGLRDTVVPEGANLPGAGSDTGAALRKFIDKLPQPGVNSTLFDGTTAKTIPVAVTSKWTNPAGVLTADDYLEVAVVEYTEKFHTDLKKATTMRGYVQIDHVASNSTTGASLPGSEAIPLTYPDGSPIMINATDANGKLTGGAKVQAKAVHAPHFLGPVIAATKDVPTRVKFLNLLPAGRAVITSPAVKDAQGNTTAPAVIGNRRGDLFLPLDPSLAGAGIGPDGANSFTQNRANIHLHGGDTPWISDGTPEQWITPIGEYDPAIPGSLANDAATPDLVADPAGNVMKLDPSYLPEYLKGASAVNVPDMNDPGPGAMTYYFPNGQSARMLWYHDHSVGMTRLNVYAGEAAGYLLTDAVEQGLISNGTLPPADRTIPLVLQDRTFVPDDIALQDARWNTTAWGAPGDSWFPHVYETVQDPAQQNNWNAVGRWHYGPWFWPVFPALYPLPSGEYGDVTTTPEAWMDTPIVNGVAYPTLEVDPTTYRFRMLNASNDRMMTVNLFVADTKQVRVDMLNPGTGYTPGETTVALNDGVNPLAVGTPVIDGTGRITAITVNANTIPANGFAKEPAVIIYSNNLSGSGASAQARFTEVPMIDASAAPAGVCDPGVTRPQPAGAGNPAGSVCTPETWQFDNRAGGLPDPKAVGPTLYQIANEGGFLPKVAAIDPAPMSFILDKGRINVLNVDTPALFMGPAERADVVVDFSQYAGKTLIVYNDSGAPIPAGDPRNDYFTGDGDQSTSGGAENTKPGYGPNTRTMMQIRVKAASTTTPATTPIGTALDSAISAAYAASQEKPVVGQSAYNAAFPQTTWNDVVNEAYASIYVGSLKEPQFTFIPGTPSASFNSVTVTNGGTGYTSAPTVTFDDATSTTETGAKANATLKISNIAITNNGGSGYVNAPLVTITSVNGATGSGATATSSLKVTGFKITNGGTNYTAAPTLTFSLPQIAGGVRATGTATISGGKVTGVTITNAGSGYTTMPTITVTGGTTGTKAVISAKGAVEKVTLTAPDPLNPASVGGGGYNNLTATGLAINFTAPPAGGTAPTAAATGSVFDVTMVNGGTGYTPSTTVGFTGGAGTGAEAFVDTNPANTVTGGNVQGKSLVKTKAIHELFDSTYGRLNSIGAVELPFTSALTQTTIPLAYIDEATESFADGETQIWKFTHNGVDTHPVHFHLLNVQLINRVGWDGHIMPPNANEVGWKETVKMNPLEDVIVAVRAKRVPLGGFGLPNSVRPMDPSQPLGSNFGFTQVDTNTGNPKVVANELRNYSWEYVWHCHILGHEENDFMRPIVFNGNEVVPAAGPANVTVGAAVATGTDYSVQVGWTDATPLKTVMSDVEKHDPSAEIGFRVERQLNGGAWTTAGTAADIRDVTIGVDPTFTSKITSQVNTLANAVSFTDTVPAPTGAVTTWDSAQPSATATATSVTLSWGAVTGATSYDVYSGTAPNGTLLGTVTAPGYTHSGLTAGLAYDYYVVAKGGADSYLYRVQTVTSAGDAASAIAGPVTVGTASSAESAGVNISTPLVNLTTPATWAAARASDLATWVGANNAGNSVQLNFTDNAVGETGYNVEFCYGAPTQCTAATAVAAYPAGNTSVNLWYTVPAANVTYTAPATPADTGVASIVATLKLALANNYKFRITPVAGATTGTVSAISTPVMNLNQTTNPANVTGVLTASSATPGQVTLSGWNNVANNTTYVIQRAPVSPAGVVGAYANFGTAAGNVTSTTLASTAGTYRFRMRQITPAGAQSNNWLTMTANVVVN